MDPARALPPPPPPVRRSLRALAALAALVATSMAGTAPAAAEGLPALDASLLAQARQWAAGPDGPAASLAMPFRVEVEPGRLDPRLRLAPCRRIEPRWPERVAPSAPIRIALRCVDGERPWQVYLPLVVRLFAPAVVSARALPAGATLAASDLKLAEIDWAALPQPPFARLDELVGRALVRATPAGHALRGADLRQRQWFDSGDPVTIVARGAGFTISGEAQALGAGVEGRVVRVRTESGRVLSGMPVGQRRVELLL